MTLAEASIIAFSQRACMVVGGVVAVVAAAAAAAAAEIGE